MRDRVFVHLTWTTQSRSRAIDAKIAMFLCRFLPVICRQERARLLGIGIVSTHVHTIVRLHPTTKIPRLVQRLKGGSSVLINRARWTPNNVKWAKGYNLESVSPSDLRRALSYVHGQSSRHPNEAIDGFTNPVGLPTSAEPRLKPR